MQRQLKKEVKIGNLKIGGTNPIAVQTMLNVPVKDIAGNVAQAQRVAAAGCQIVRVTVPTPADMTTSIEESAHSHVMAFATEHARLTGQVVDVAEFERRVMRGELDY